MQIKGFSNARFKGFRSKQDAERFVLTEASKTAKDQCSGEKYHGPEDENAQKKRKVAHNPYLWYPPHSDRNCGGNCNCPESPAAQSSHAPKVSQEEEKTEKDEFDSFFVSDGDLVQATILAEQQYFDALVQATILAEEQYSQRMLGSQKNTAEENLPESDSQKSSVPEQPTAPARKTTCIDAPPRNNIADQSLPIPSFPCKNSPNQSPVAISSTYSRNLLSKEITYHVKSSDLKQSSVSKTSSQKST
mmetsp:Transcript_31395/g.65549  ORF Transcript_31395/g.65549 Transcript_31395/m.65549 type:complete len:247 (+) Transcript_31395:101-841(+)